MDNYSEDIIQKVWNKGVYIGHNDPNMWRKDECGAWMGRHFYGNHESTYGWEIARLPDEVDIKDDPVAGLIPLQWQNQKESTEGKLVCKVTASAKHKFKNVEGHLIDGYEIPDKDN